MSADEDWSEAVKASINNADPGQVDQADFLPTSSQSPGNSPQRSPDSQQKDLPSQHQSRPHGDQLSLYSSHQDQHISQSGVPPSNSSRPHDQPVSGQKSGAFEAESQQHQAAADPHKPNRADPPRTPHSQGNGKPQGQGSFLNKGRMDPNALNPSFPHRHPRPQQTRPSGPRQAFPAQQPNQHRPPFNSNNSARHPQPMRMSTPPRQQNMQSVRPNFKSQNVSDQHNMGAGQQQQQQQPQRIPQQQAPQRPANPSSGAANVNQGKRMTSPGLNTQTVRPPTGSASPGGPRMASPQQAQISQNHPVNNQSQAQRPVGMVGQGIQPCGTNRPGNRPQTQGMNRMPLPQRPAQGFSNPQQKGQPLQRQNMDNDGAMLEDDGEFPEYDENEDMYYDDDDEDYDEEMDDDEEMEYPGYQIPPVFGHGPGGYPSDDSDELSEEESALLEELRECEDDERVEAIVTRLREKGVDPEEIEEMLYHSDYPGGEYGDNYDEGEEEGAVSSSSQDHGPFQQNHPRTQMHMDGQNFSGQPGGQNQGGSSQTSLNVHNPHGAFQQGISATSPHSRLAISSAPSGMHSQQGMSSSSSGVVSQQPKISAPQGTQVQSQQQVSNNRPPVSFQPGAQGQAPQTQQQQQQSQLKLIGQPNTNQQRKVFQNNPVQPAQPTPQANQWQPLPIKRAQNQTPVKPGDARQPAPKAIPQISQPQGLQAPRPQMNRPPQPGTQGQGQSVRPQTQNKSSGMVVRPVQHLTIMTNNQPNAQGQMGQSRPLIVRQDAPTSNMVISSLPSNQQGGYMGPPQVQPPMVRAVQPRPPFQMQQRPSGSGQQVTGQSQPLGNPRPVRPGNQNMFQQQNRINSPQLKAALNRDTAPSEASLARLTVQYMQQSLDQEIRAKKGVQSTPGHSGPTGVFNDPQTFNVHNRFASPQNMSSFPQGQFNQSIRPQQQNQNFPGYEPKHTLPPRQPIPAIVNPNANTTQALSGGRPICSVVPFQSQNRRQATPTNVQRPNAPPQNPNFQRPRNPVAAPQVHNVPQHSPGLAQSRMSAPNVQQGPVASPGTQGPGVSPGQVMSPNRGPVPGTTAAPGQSQNMPQVPVPDQVQQQQQPQQQQQLQQPHGAIPKAESFSLDRLSEDKCIITGKGKQQGLTVNMVYQIRSPIDQSLVLALWNGERFEDLNQADVKALGQSGQMAAPATSGSQPSQKQGQDMPKAQAVQSNQGQAASEKEKCKDTPSSSSGGSTSEFQAKFLQSLSQQTNEEDEESWSNTDSQSLSSHDTDAPEQGSSTEGKVQKSNTDDSTNQTTYIKPLPQGQNQQRKEEQMEDEDDDSIFKKPFSENEDYFRVCNHCGYTSKNFRRCEGCKRVFQGEVKIHTLKKNVKVNTAAASSSASSKTPGSAQREDSDGKKKDPYSQVMSNVSFYRNQNSRGRGGRPGRGGSGRTRGGGLKGRMGNRGAQGEEGDSSDSDESSVDAKRSSDGSASDGPAVKRRPTRPKSKNPTPRKRSKKFDEPVTVTISSDEDEPSSTSNNLPGHAPSPAHSAGSESPLFPSTPSEPINAFGRFRRALMEDEEGNSKLSKKIQQRIGNPMERGEEEEDEDEDDDEDGDEPPIYEIDIRSVRIGSMRTQPEGPLLINLRGVCFRVRSERTEEPFECEILAQEVEQVKFCAGQSQPVLFLFLSQECGETLRRICHMKEGDDEYFDPSSTDMKQKMVVIIIEGFNYMPTEMLRETLSLWADMNHTEDDVFIDELSEESANDLLIQSAPPVLTADVERDVVKFKKRYLRDSNQPPSMSRAPGSPSDSTDNEPDSTSSSPPEMKHHHLGGSVRLLQYPPPPARGLPITTEDLYCLTEGEFLNDVIIDFYLQYLYQEKLSEENKRRTHIFSSFFYKRLTQRDRHIERSEEDAKKSLPERRHARVKKWTKTVDLFSKDFIVVPINEHSHWYLAVICFPGLANPEVVPYIPCNAHKSDPDDESNDTAAGDEGAAEESTSQDSLPKTILGKQLDPKKCLDSEDTKYNIGQKQPCILMFDSLAGPSRNPNVKMLREYLQCEWNAKKSETRNIAKILRGSTPKVPQQSNYSDCGVYLLQYVESFFEDPIADFQIPMKGLQSWFPEDVVHNKRREIHELIMDLHRRFQEDRGDPNVLEFKFESLPREPHLRPPQMSEQNSKSDEGFSGSGIGRDDESSNSSHLGDHGTKAMTETDTDVPSDTAMDENSSSNFLDQITEEESYSETRDSINENVEAEKQAEEEPENP